VPRIVELLSESYNSHVRCGATFALGITCAGAGLQDAVQILEPMTKDSVDFVRPGAPDPTIRRFLAITRALYDEDVSDKHEDLLARFGTALGRGYIDTGGRNVTIVWRVETQVRSSVW
jgi:26S proteasome regulatory subunit N2